MQIQRISLTVILTFLITVITTCFSPLLISVSTVQVFAQTPDNRKVEADRLFQQAIEQLNRNQPEAAIQFWEQARRIYQQIGARLKEAESLGNIGIVHRGRGEYAKALQALEEVLKIMQSLNNLRGQSRALQQLGLLHRALGNFDQALNLLQQQLKVAQTIPNRAEEAAANGNIGLIYMDMEKYEEAIKAMQQQLAMAQELNDGQQQENALANLGLVSESLGRYDDSLSYYEQVLAMKRSRGDRIAEGYILGDIGLLYRARGEYKKAIQAIRRYVESARQSGDRRGEGVALNNLGVVLYESGNIEEAVPTLYAAIEIRESLRSGLDDANKISIVDANYSTYGTLQLALIKQKKPDKALEISERGRARAFLELLYQKLSLQSKNNIIEPPGLITLEKIKQIAEQQNATLVEYSILPQTSEIFIWIIKPTGEVNFQSIDLKKQQNITLANFVPRIRNAIGVRSGTNNNEAAFKPGDRIHFKGDKPNTEPWEVVSFEPQNGILRVRLPSFIEGLTIPKSINDVEDFGQTSLQQLHQILIEPIADLLPKNASDRVIFIPQGELFLVPFPALQDKDGKYLIEKHTILTAPSIQVLDLTRKQRQRLANSTAKDMLVVGNPSPMPAPFQPLEYAELEARAIANLLNTRAITGTQATESAIIAQMSNVKMIHLATHGQFDDIRGLGSAIALAPSGKDDGLLTAEEILNLKLNAELVVLSACDTGRGRLTGDGVIGLSRSLISAGVPSVIVSLWKVPDNTTSGLMVEFYRQLKGNPDKAQALRQAMLNTMKQHPNPRDWAAFTLIGEAE